MKWLSLLLSLAAIVSAGASRVENVQLKKQVVRLQEEADHAHLKRVLYDQWIVDHMRWITRSKELALLQAELGTPPGRTCAQGTPCGDLSNLPGASRGRARYPHRVPEP